MWSHGDIFNVVQHAATPRSIPRLASGLAIFTLTDSLHLRKRLGLFSTPQLQGDGGRYLKALHVAYARMQLGHRVQHSFFLSQS